MIRLFVRHPVQDVDRWLTGYRELSTLRAEHGVVADGVYRSVDDAKDLTVWHDFETLESAQAFAANPLLESAMKDLGVAGPPSIWFTRAMD